VQERELDLDELGRDDSSYLQEHQLKRKIMSIFSRLCELKGCTNMTGRVIEQRLYIKCTRHPEVNRHVERLINKPGFFPDLQDVKGVVRATNQRYNLGLSPREVHNVSLDAFREACTKLQERRHLDLVYNFGCHLTEDFKPSSDPARYDGELEAKLRRNRVVALQHLEDVVNKYAELEIPTSEQDKQEPGRRDGRDSRHSRDSRGSKDKQPRRLQGQEEERQQEEGKQGDEADDESSEPDVDMELEGMEMNGG
uniref:Daxx histone-binding domain-containing protein n=1 Tax=Petromyzon marinus TaxID=7757 RepID=S4RHT7_PETMA